MGKLINILLLMALGLFGGAAVGGGVVFAEDLESLWQNYTTPAYKKAAVESILDQVNAWRSVLPLKEKSRISQDDLVETMIATPFHSDHSGCLGTVRTGNYVYSVNLCNRLAAISRTSENRAGEMAELLELKRKYLIPVANINTNRAYDLATSWLKALDIDVEALSRDSQIKITPWMIGTNFVPIYSVVWSQPCAFQNSVLPTEADYEPAASVELLEPENVLRKLSVSKGQYLRRPELKVPNRDQLLDDGTNSLGKMWKVSEGYKRAAVKVTLKEVNEVGGRLRLDEHFPVAALDLTETIIDGPSVSQQLGSFGTVCTAKYVYTANRSNKLCYIGRNFRNQTQPQYDARIKQKYLSPKKEVNFTAAKELAMNWLADFGVDTSRLNSRCSCEQEVWEIGNMIVPYYTFKWVKAEDEQVIATVKLLYPEKSIELVWVTDPNYILRKSLKVETHESNGIIR